MSGKFTYINSFEETDAELSAATRDINEVVVHWTANYLDQYPTAQDIEAAHLARGFSEIGYHYIIHRDGSIQRGRDINKVGAHAGNDPNPAFGRNKYTIGISFVGGINLTVSEARSLGVYESNTLLGPYCGTKSLTDLQFQSFDGFMDSFFWVFPHGQAVGHMEVPYSTKIDPGFDVAAYCFNKFGKTRIVDPSQGPSISTTELLELALARGTS